MTVVSEILAEATRYGVEIDPRGGMLNLHAQHEPPADLLDRLRDHKQEIMDTLATGKPKALPQGVAAAYRRLSATLAGTPTITFASEVLPDTGGDSVLMAAAVKGVGLVVLTMPKAKYDEGKLLELTHRWNHGSKPA